MKKNKVPEIEMNDKMYKGNPCRVCGNPIRYISIDTCVACMKRHSRASYAKPEVQERAREYQKLNNKTRKRKEYMREYMRRYRKEHKETFDAAQKKYNEENKELIAARRKKRWEDLTDIQKDIIRNRIKNQRKARIKKALTNKDN